jgi:hypothetical protein
VEDLPLEYIGDENGYRITYGSDTKDKKKNREVLPSSGQGLYLAETNGGDGDEGHVEAVADGPAFDQPEAHGPYQDQEKQEQEGDQEPYEGRKSAHWRENKDMHRFRKSQGIELVR